MTPLSHQARALLDDVRRGYDARARTTMRDASGQLCTWYGAQIHIADDGTLTLIEQGDDA